MLLEKHKQLAIHAEKRTHHVNFFYCYYLLHMSSAVVQWVAIIAPPHRWFRSCTWQTSQRRASLFRAQSTASACCSPQNIPCTFKTSWVRASGVMMLGTCVKHCSVAGADIMMALDDVVPSTTQDPARYASVEPCTLCTSLQQPMCTCITTCFCGYADMSSVAKCSDGIQDHLLTVHI